MAEDVNASIGIDIDTSKAIAAIRQLSAEISAFHQLHSKKGAAVAKDLAAQTQNLTQLINRSGAYRASMTSVASATESFTTALEKNKLTMGETMRYAMGSMKPFSRMFKSEWEMVSKVARERVKDLQTSYIRLGRDANGAVQAIKIRPLTLDMDNLQTKTMLAAQRMQVLNKLVEHGSTQLLNWGKNTQWAGRQLMVGFTIPLTMLGAASAKTFMDMEKQIIKIQRVYGDFSTTVEDTKKMTDALKELSLEFTKWGVSVNDTLGLAADAAATGAMGADLINQVTNATKLAVLGNVEQSKALETTMSVTNAFGIATEDLAKKIDFLNAVENQSVTSIEDLTTAIPIAAPVVKQLGGSVEDLAFFMTAMKEGGIDAGEGANALKSGLASIINPTEKASQMLMEYGINLNEIVSRNQGNVKGTVIEFAQALDKLDPLNRAQAIEQLFGKFQFSRISTLFQNVIKEGTQAQRVLELSQASTEQLAVLSQRELAKVEDSTTYKFESAMQRFQASLAPVGEEFLKAVTPLLDFGTSLLEQFNKWDDGAKTFAVTFAAVLGGIGPVLLMTIGLVANGVANLIKLFQFFAKGLFSAGKSTDILGMQTDYMTQNMIEAQAAASSLSQTHSNLTQVYTSEASALKNLAAALQQTAAAQRGLSGGPIIGRTRSAKGFSKGTMSVPKYASGVVSVPGPKGKGDVVPAMLSPGEAVIPTDMAKKYAPLINGMISGNIPGYQLGRRPIKSNTRKQTGREKAHIQDPLDIFNDLQALEAVSRRFNNIDLVPPEVLKRLVFTGSIVANVGKDLNQALKGGGQVDPAKFQLAWSSIKDKLLGTAVAGGLDINDPQARQALKEIEVEVGKRAVALARAAGTGVTDAIISSAVKEINQEAIAAGGSKAQVASQIESRRYVLGDVRSTYTKEELAQGLKNGTFVQVGQQVKEARSGIVVGDYRRSSSGKDPGLKQKASSIGGYQKQPDLSTIIDEPNAMLGAKYYENARSAQVKEKVVTPRQRRITQSEAIAMMTPAEKGKLTKAINTGNEKLAAQLLAAKRKEIRAAEEQAAIAEREAKTAKRSEAARRGVETRRANAERKAALAAEQEAKSRTLGARFGNAARNAGQRVKGFVTSGRGAMVGSAASMGLMMASGIEGPVGNVAGAISGPMMMLSMLGPVLGSIPAPVTAVVVALGALAAVGIGTKMAFDDAQRAAEKFAQSTGASTKSIDALAEASGQVSATQEMNVRRETSMQFARTEQTNAIASQYLASDAGIATVSSIGSALSSGGMNSAVTNIVSQMSTAIASGAISAVDAKAIVEDIGKQLGNQTFALQANAKIEKLIGPNGEDLAKDPIGVRLNILEGTQKQLVGLSSEVDGLFKDITTEMIPNMIGNMTDFSSLESSMKSIGMIVAATTPIPLIIEGISQVQELGTQTAAFAANMVIAGQQSQQMLDSLQLEYEQRIANAQAAGNVAEAERLATEYAKGRQDLLTQSANTLQAASDAYSQMESNAKTGVIGSLDQQIKDLYAEGPMKAIAEQAIAQIGNLTADGSQIEFTLKTAVATGQIDPSSVNTLLGILGEQNVDVAANIITKFGGATADQIFEFTSLIQDQGRAQDFVMKFEGMSPEEATAATDLLTNIGKFGGQTALTVALNTDGKLDELAQSYKMIDELTSAGPITMETLIINDEAAFGALKSQSEYFNSLPVEQQKVFLSRYLTVYETVTPGQAAKALRDAGVQPGQYEGSMMTYTASQLEYGAGLAAASSAKTFTEAFNAVVGGDGSTGNGGGGGGAAKTAEEQLLDNLNFLLGKQQKALSLIAMQEEEINKKYDDRKEALAEIAAINAQIAEEQRGQLDLAGALASGDIAAAARAAQTIRAQAAEKAMKDQEKSLEDSRKAELARVSFDGLTRDQLEGNIKDLERKIAELEYRMPQKQETGGGGGGGFSGGADATTTDASTGTSAITKATTTKTTSATVTGPTLTSAPVAPNPRGYIGNDEGYVKALNEFNAATIQWKTQTYSAIDALKLSGTQFQVFGGNTDALKAKIIAMGGTITSEGIVKIKGITTDLASMSDQLKLIGPNVQTAAEEAYKAVFDTGGTARAAEEAAIAAADAASSAAIAAGKASGAAYKAANSIRVATGQISLRAYEAQFGAAKSGGLITGPGTGTSDSIPTMLSNGEYVIRAASVAKIGTPLLDAINEGRLSDIRGASVSVKDISINSRSASINNDSASSNSGSVYNYNVVVNAETNADADQIASAVMSKIKQVEGQRVRGVVR